MATDNQNGNIASAINSKYISIKPENGESFNPGQKIIYNIEPSIGYIKKDSYLMFDVVNTTADNGRYTWNTAGAHGLINQINIYSKETGVLLENLNNYNQWVGIENQYITDDKTQLAIKEGVRLPCEARHNFEGGDQSHHSLPEGQHNTNHLFSPVEVGGNAVFMERRYCIPLRCGIFRHWDDERLIPILNFGGLRIELFLAPPEECLQRLPCASEVAIRVDGHLNTDVSAGQLIATRAGAADVVFALQGINTIKKCGFCVGNRVIIRAEIGGANGVVNTARSIIGMTDDGAGLVSITVDGGVIGTTTNVALMIADIPTALGGVNNSANAVNPNYRITNTEYRLCVVAPSSAQSKALSSAINYEFTSYDLFLDNVPSTSLRHQVPLHSVASKAKCITTMIYDPAQEKNVIAQNYYAGLQNHATPITTYNNDIVFFINNKLYPLRSYNPTRLRDRVLALNEQVKSFDTINKPIMSFGDNRGGNIKDFVNTSLICRELARGEFVFDLRNAEPEIRLGFSAARAGNLRVNSFVWSKKIISTSSSGVQVIY